MTPVTDDMVKEAEQFREAAKTDADLRDEQAVLEQERARMEAERPQIIYDDQQVRALEAQVISLRRRSGSDYLAGGGANGWLGIAANRLTLNFKRNGVVTGTSNSDRRTFTGSYYLSGSSITIVLGPSRFVGDISGNQMTGTRSRSDGKNDTWAFTFTGERPNLQQLLNELAMAESQLAAAKSQLQMRRSKYNSAKQSFAQRLSTFQRRRTQQADLAKLLATHGHSRPTLNARPTSARTIVPKGKPTRTTTKSKTKR